MRKIVLTTIMALCMTMLAATAAFAAHSVVGDRTGWATKSALGCASCHSTAEKHTYGPHGGYSASTTKCAACHTVHKAGNARLLPGSTVTAACNYCHDLTGTAEGPYSAAKLPNAAAAKSAHRVAGIVYFNSETSWGNAGNHMIPGGDDTTGGNVYLDTTEQGTLSGATFTCDSCHTPHAVTGSTVGKYLGDSIVKQTNRKSGATMEAGGRLIFLTDRILKDEINGQTAAEYGTAWCATCHRGRDNMGAATNHPVNEAAPAYPYLEAGYMTWLNGSSAAAKTAGYVYIDTAGSASGLTSRNFDEEPRSNKHLAMEANDPLTGTPRPDGSVAYASGAGPSCQQCHGSARDVETAFWSDFDTTPLEGQMTFPHLSTNKALLVETGDDFCTNCHGITNLP